MRASSLYLAVPFTALSVVLFGCGSDIKTVEQPYVVMPDGTHVPVTTDDEGELEEGETKVEVEGPKGDKEVTVEVDE